MVVAHNDALCPAAAVSQKGQLRHYSLKQYNQPGCVAYGHWCKRIDCNHEKVKLSLTLCIHVHFNVQNLDEILLP